MKKDLLFPLRRVHGMLYEWRIKKKNRRAFREKYRTQFDQKKSHNPKTVFLVLTPEHTNLGDHAIALSEITLLNEHGIDYVEITGKQLVEMQKCKCLNIMNGCPIIINGGGNLGTLWYSVEQLMRDTISSNPKSPIFIMPNTIYYENTIWGHEEFERSKTIYNAHTKLRLYAREHISFNIMHEAYKTVKLAPDLVLSMDWSRGETTRTGCLLCMRSDCERTCTEQEQRELFDIMQTCFGNNVRYTDMHATHSVSISDREQALTEKYKEFRNASLVITDRLHGMIFCAITGTPCIVINSRSPKLKGCYEWIKHLEYIKFCENISDVLALYHSIPDKTHTYDNSDILRWHKDLIHDIAESIWDC